MECCNEIVVKELNLGVLFACENTLFCSDLVITRKIREIDGWTYVCEQSAPNAEKIRSLKKGAVR